MINLIVDRFSTNSFSKLRNAIIKYWVDIANNNDTLDFIKIKSKNLNFVDFETITDEINEVNKKYKYDKYNNHDEILLITYTQYKDNEAFAGYSNNYTLRVKVFRNNDRAEADNIGEIYFYLTKSINYSKKLYESEIRKQNGIKVNERISTTLKKITINKMVQN